MKRHAFQGLLESVRQVGKIRQKELRASRVKAIKPVNVRAIRSRLELTQSEFACMIGVSVATLRNWEQGRRAPDGPARALLRVAAVHPEVVAAALRV